jgi:hypothetical protein
MLLQKYLRENSVEHLIENYAIKVKRHGKYPNLALFKYDQINSPMGDKIVQECRGVILNEANDWAVVARPYDKFFNYGEGHAADIDWNTAKVYEKLDGSLMTLYYFRGEWHVSSSGSPDASGEVNGLGFTFAELFWKTWNDLGYKLPSDEECDLSFMFELMTPYNTIVVNHENPRLILHGVRNWIGDEYNPAIPSSAHGWECVQSFPLTNWDECIKAAAMLNGACSEGYVVCDANYSRVKLKCPQYVAIHHLKEGFSPKRMLEIVRGAESDEVLAYFPQYADMIAEIREKYNAEIAAIRAAYEAHKDIEDQKTFALAVKDYPLSGILFSLRNKKIASIEDGLAKMPIKSLMERLKIKDLELIPSE